MAQELIGKGDQDEKQNGKLDPAFRETFIDNKGRQFAAILSDIGAKKDVSEIKNKVTSVVNKVLVKWLTIFENEFTDSPEEVKEACIETFSKWLYLSIQVKFYIKKIIEY